MSAIGGQSLQIELLAMGQIVGFENQHSGGFSSRQDQQGEEEGSGSSSSESDITNNMNTWATSTAVWLQEMIENNYMQMVSAECSFGLKVFCPTLCYNLSSVF